jgi:hypothetical protein
VETQSSDEFLCTGLQKNVESQTDAFGKAGISFFCITWVMLASTFSRERLVEHLGVEEADKLKPGDKICIVTSTWCDDAKQVFSALKSRCSTFSLCCMCGASCLWGGAAFFVWGGVNLRGERVNLDC